MKNDIKNSSFLKGVSMGVLLCAVSACATTDAVNPTGSAETAAKTAQNEQASELYDTNHFFYDFNNVIDHLFLQPIARLYDAILPDFVQDRVSDFLSNFREPLNIVNYTLQGNFEMAGTSLGRFATNTTMGFFGIVDVASEAGVEKTRTDFGLTLASWGVRESDYFVVPFLGPSTVRDAVGFGVDALINPFNLVAYFGHSDTWEAFDWTRYGVQVVSGRAEALPLTDDIELHSLDPYATMQTMYMQNRKYQIEGKIPPKDKASPVVQDYDFEMDMEDEPLVLQ